MLTREGIAGYYETSAKLRINVEEIMFDAVRFVRRQALSEEHNRAKRQLSKLSGPAGLLPWNWSKKAQYALSTHLTYSWLSNCTDSPLIIFLTEFFFF